MPRDGRFIEKLGTYNPLLPKDSEERVKLDLERVQYWLDQGAQPSDRVSRFLEAAGVLEKKERANLKKKVSRARKPKTAQKKKPKKLLPLLKLPLLRLKKLLPRNKSFGLDLTCTPSQTSFSRILKI